jgi:hypothetical protein
MSRSSHRSCMSKLCAHQWCNQVICVILWPFHSMRRRFRVVHGKLNHFFVGLLAQRTSNERCQNICGKRGQLALESIAKSLVGHLPSKAWLRPYQGIVSSCSSASRSQYAPLPSLRQPSQQPNHPRYCCQSCEEHAKKNNSFHSTVPVSDSAQCTRFPPE